MRVTSSGAGSTHLDRPGRRRRRALTIAHRAVARASGAGSARDQGTPEPPHGKRKEHDREAREDSELRQVLRAEAEAAHAGRR